MPDIKPVQPAPENEVEIHVIPDEFYGAAARARIPKARAAAPAAAPALPGSPAPAAPPAQASQSKAWLLIPIGAVVILAVLGVVAWFLLQKKAPAAPAPAAPLVTLPSAPAEQPSQPEQPAPAPEQPSGQVATTTPEQPSAPAAPETPLPVVSASATGSTSLDADNDGLTEVEEQLYGTKADNPDTDGDGFSDSVELTNLYNPLGFKPTKLIEAAGLVKTYSSEEGGYQIFYPSSWDAEDKSGGEAIFRNPQNEPVSVTIEDNPGEQSVLDWYLTRNPDVSPSDIQLFSTKSGLTGVKGADGLAAYISEGKKVYVIAYVPGDQPVYFSSTFTMMINSFDILNQ